MLRNDLKVQPFALDEGELRDIEMFAARNELHNIARLCAELRALRRAHLELSTRLGKMQNGRPDTLAPNRRFSQEMDVIINFGGHNASPVP